MPGKETVLRTREGIGRQWRLKKANVGGRTRSDHSYNFKTIDISLEEFFLSSYYTSLELFVTHCNTLDSFNAHL